MYELYQSLKGGVESIDAYSLDATLRKLRKETGLKIYLSKVKWLDYDDKFNCDIYTIELDLEKKSE